jgi:hypothetical protein
METHIDTTNTHCTWLLTFLARDRHISIPLTHTVHGTGRWFSPGTPVFSCNKTDHHDLEERGFIFSWNIVNFYLLCLTYVAFNMETVKRKPNWSEKETLMLVRGERPRGSSLCKICGGWSALFGETYEHKSHAAVCYWTHFICLYKDAYLEWKHFVYSLLKAWFLYIFGWADTNLFIMEATSSQAVSFKFVVDDFYFLGFIFSWNIQSMFVCCV